MGGKERRRTRISSKIDELPDEVKAKVDEMLLDASITFQEVSDWIKTKGFLVSKSSVGRYALRTGEAVKRIQDAQKQTEALVAAVKKHPENDYTNAGMMLLMDGLIKKLVVAQEEFDDLPLDKAGRLITALSRTKVYKDKVRHDMKKKVELAFEGMEAEIMKAIKSDPGLAVELKTVIEKAKAKMISDTD